MRMSVPHWTCKCRRHHTPNLKRCRHCGDLQSNYSTNGEAITAKRDKAPQKPKEEKLTAKVSGRYEDSCQARQANGETYFESKMPKERS
jgi:hypothetical protein